MIESARNKPSPIEVMKMKPTDFTSFKDYTNLRKLSDKKKFILFQMHQMKYQKYLFGPSNIS